MMPDVQFYAAAIPAVLLVGLSKGGLGGALALMGVPILALVVPPMQAAAIFLPILIVMDLAALFTWRHNSEKSTLFLMLPGAIIGIALGWATSAMVPANAMRLVLGFVTVVFALRFFYDAYGPRSGQTVPARKHRPLAATLWGTLSGYGSFVAHAGGPPFQIYTLPLKFDPKTYTGMSVRFFAIMNAIKVAPYFALGELDTANLTTSASLLPVAIIATFAGAWVVRHMRPQAFYPLMYFMALLAGTKLFWDGTQF